MAEYSSLTTCSNEVFIIGQIFMVECLQLSGLYLLNHRVRNITFLTPANDIKLTAPSIRSSRKWCVIMMRQWQLAYKHINLSPLASSVVLQSRCPNNRMCKKKAVPFVVSEGSNYRLWFRPDRHTLPPQTINISPDRLKGQALKTD